jgi:hypothetical protein
MWDNAFFVFQAAQIFQTALTGARKTRHQFLFALIVSQHKILIAFGLSHALFFCIKAAVDCFGCPA